MRSVAEPAGEKLGSLFVQVTGQASVTERQRLNNPVRRSEDDADISTYIDSITKATGLDDVISDPER